MEQIKEITNHEIKLKAGFVEKLMTKEDVLFLKKHNIIPKGSQIHLKGGIAIILKDKNKSQIRKYIDPQTFTVLSTFTRNHYDYPNHKFFFGKGTRMIYEKNYDTNEKGFYTDHSFGEVFWNSKSIFPFVKPYIEYVIETIGLTN